MSTPEPTKRVRALLLAAGRGSRFDPSGQRSKLLADFEGQPVAIRALRALRAAGLPVTAVVRERGELAERLALAGAEVVIFPGAQAGMGASLAHGVQCVRRACAPDALVVALGDMPSIRPETIHALLAEVDDDHPIVAPEYGGRRGHPVVFWHSRLDALSGLDGDRGAAALLRSDTPTLVEVDDAAILLDIDEPGDLPAG
ncbi:MAG: nucleotidyltransferase family protein [Burkholderiaceae bacterium]